MFPLDPVIGLRPRISNGPVLFDVIPYVPFADA